jgi:Rps23 Pro-64 3,4-dihydroxylase Tpa1-like proline 4-hydroxylase
LIGLREQADDIAMTSPATVVLQGGFTLEIEPDNADPIAQALLSGELLSRNPQEVVELAVTNGQRVRFRAGAVVAVILGDAAGADQANAAVGESTEAETTLELKRPAMPFMVMKEFLAPAQHAELIQLALAAESRFLPSTTAGGSGRRRSSLVLQEDARIAAIMLPRLNQALPDVARRLDITRAAAATGAPAVECQVTAHNDGDFYGMHNDSGAAGLKHRTISYVYYFRASPKPFRGGELRLYEVAVKNGVYEAGDEHWLIEPKDNSAVFFPSHTMHEVLPVNCRSKHFADSRFTVNGWISY